MWSKSSPWGLGDAAVEISLTSQLVSAPWRLLPATEPTQLGGGMNAYKYQKFLEGLNNLRGITDLLAPCLLSLLIVQTLTVVVYCMGSLLFINPF